jgi:hypothetical protein
MMRSCASAAKLRAAGPFFRSASSARFEYGIPPPRIVNSAVVLNSQRERRMVLSNEAQGGFILWLNGVRQDFITGCAELSIILRWLTKLDKG